MSLLIKALNKAQAAKAQEAKAQDANLQNLKLQTDDQSEISANSVIKPELPVSEKTNMTANAASAKLAAGNALEMELSPIANENVAYVKETFTGGAANNQFSNSEASKNVAGKNIQGTPNDYGAENSADVFAAANTSRRQTLAASKAIAGDNRTSTSQASAKSAANVFAAKRIESNRTNTILAVMAGVSLCVLLAVAAYFYLFLDRAPEFSPSFSQNLSAVKPVITPLENATPAIDSPLISDTQTAQQTNQPVTTPVAELALQESATQAQKPIKQAPKSAAFRTESLTENEAAVSQMLVEKTSDNQLANTNQQGLINARNAPRAVETQQIASKSASIQVSKTRQQLGVNPVLMDAYHAYNAGNDALASKLYRQVLQRDIRNVDALLGLGAIAQRQGRIADSNGWYAKVLELEPRNALATSAILNSQQPTNLANQTDAANNESRIKNMLAKQPDDANLHATLGNYYADLNQWAAAQQAYFDAFRLNASADNAFNLAISLDQLGKPKLALPYYQRALQMAQLGSSHIDQNALQARIAAIQ